MSTRQERQSNKTQNEMHLQILKELVSRPENKKCADCKKKDSRWVSINLGVFVCIRCSGIHRSIGVHITKIRSIDLDTFTPEQIQEVSKWGNAKANYYWEASLPAGHEPNESTLEQFIRSKYERKQYVRSPVVPDPNTIDLTQPQPIQNQSQQQGFGMQQNNSFRASQQQVQQNSFVNQVMPTQAPVPSQTFTNSNPTMSTQKQFFSSSQQSFNPSFPPQNNFGQRNSAQFQTNSSVQQNVMNAFNTQNQQVFSSPQFSNFQQAASFQNQGQPNQRSSFNGNGMQGNQSNGFGNVQSFMNGNSFMQSTTTQPNGMNNLNSTPSQFGQNSMSGFTNINNQPMNNVNTIANNQFMTGINQANINNYSVFSPTKQQGQNDFGDFATIQSPNLPSQNNSAKTTQQADPFANLISGNPWK